jgi:DNA-directed RNA polymerase specialized sigma24 family protein
MTEEELDELRPSAFAIAYRMLGSVSEVEDVVQEGFLRLRRPRRRSAAARADDPPCGRIAARWVTERDARAFGALVVE